MEVFQAGASTTHGGEQLQQGIHQNLGDGATGANRPRER